MAAELRADLPARDAAAGAVCGDYERREVMQLNTWHKRPDGMWCVEKGAGRYYWDAVASDRLLPYRLEDWRSGTSWFAWLARRRAIAALRKSRAD